MRMMVNKVYKIELNQEEVDTLFSALEFVLHKRDNTQEEFNFYKALLNEIEDLLG